MVYSHRSYRDTLQSETKHMDVKDLSRIARTTISSTPENDARQSKCSFWAIMRLGGKRFEAWLALIHLVAGVKLFQLTFNSY